MSKSIHQPDIPEITRSDGKKRLAGATAPAANTYEVKELRREAKVLKEVVAEQTLELRLLKKARQALAATTNEVCRIREAGDHPAGTAFLTR